MTFQTCCSVSLRLPFGWLLLRQFLLSRSQSADHTRLVTETRTGPVGALLPPLHPTPRRNRQARRNGLPFAQVIYDGSGDLVKRIEAEPRRVKLRPQVVGFESGPLTPDLVPRLGLLGLPKGSDVIG